MWLLWNPMITAPPLDGAILILGYAAVNDPIQSVNNEPTQFVRVQYSWKVLRSLIFCIKGLTLGDSIDSHYYTYQTQEPRIICIPCPFACAQPSCSGIHTGSWSTLSFIIVIYCWTTRLPSKPPPATPYQPYSMQIRNATQWYKPLILIQVTCEHSSLLLVSDVLFSLSEPELLSTPNTYPQRQCVSTHPVIKRPALNTL